MDYDASNNQNFNLNDSDKIKELGLTVRRATEHDAPQIIKLYNDTYKNSYPYEAWTDLKNVQNAINNPETYIWHIYEDKWGHIAATQFLEVDKNTGIAMMHGYMISKEYRGIGLGNIMVKDNCKPLLEDPNNKIDMCWCEVRTAHNKSQKMSQMIDFIPIAFLPFKDIFFHKRESDIIMAWYNPNRNSLKNRRPDVKITSEIIRFFNFVNDYLPSPLNEPEIEFWDHYDLQFHPNNVSINVEIQNFNYKSISLYIDPDNFMSFKINQNVNTAEEFEFSVTNTPAFNSLLYNFNKIFDNYLDYAEIWVPAYNTDLQKSCILLGFIPSGYFPAIKSSPQGNLDNIIFVKSKSYPDSEGPSSNLKLTHRTRILFDLFNDLRLKISNFQPYLINPV